MKKYFKDWSLMRWMRLGLGLFIIAQGIAATEWLFVGMGALLTLMPVLNIGCCRTSGCTIYNSDENKNLNEVVYEEIKTRQSESKYNTN